MNENKPKPVLNNKKEKVELYPPGTLLMDGSFRIIGPLGEGGMASVYKAQDLNQNIEVAIKINNPNFETEKQYDTFVQTYTAEVENIAKLNQNDNVIKLLDWDVQKGKPWLIILEYADGGSLNDLLKSHPIFSVKEMQFYFGQLTNALTAAHSLGIIHRDIKPENVFLDSLGNVKLGDFGISFLCDNTAQAQRVIGTPKFIPPEIAYKTIATFKSDIYSLGVLMYICATGIAPFTTSRQKKEGQEDLFRKHMNKAPLRPSDINPSVPPRLSNLILRMLEKSPIDRPESMAEIRQEIMSQDIFTPDKPYMYKGRKKYDFAINKEYRNNINLDKETTGRAQLFQDQLPKYLNKKLLVTYLALMIGLVTIFAAMVIFVTVGK